MAKAGRSYAVMLENLTSPDQQSAVAVATVTTGVTDLHIGNGQVGHATLLHDCTPGAIQVDAFVANRTGTVQVPVTMAPARQQR